MAVLPYDQRLEGLMTHPSQRWTNRLLFAIPVVLWRMGLGPLLARRHILILTTTGRRSGLPRHTGLEYNVVRGKVAVAAGWGQRSDWVRNLQADPLVTLQTAEGTFGAYAQRITDPGVVREMMEPVLKSGGDAYFRPWLESLDIRCDLEDVIAKRDRLVLISFEPTDQPGPPPMPTDLAWLWPVLLLSGAALCLLGRRPRRHA